MNENITNPDYKEIKPFKGWVLENFPFIEADFDAITNYELISKVVEYLNQVISNENLTEEKMLELITAYNNLKNYVDEYFTNLDVQEEINTKLDQMAQDGSLTNLIKEYVDPLINAQNVEIADIRAEVESATSGSPLVASSTSEMTDTSRVYVNTTNGNWYYHDGDSWEVGGVYQASVDSTTSSNNEQKINNSIKDIFLPYTEKKPTYYNQYSPNELTLYHDGGYINADGTITSGSRYQVRKIDLDDADIGYTFASNIAKIGAIQFADNSFEGFSGSYNNQVLNYRWQINGDKKIKTLYFNFDTTGEQGLTDLKIYRCRGNNDDKILINQYDNVVIYREIINNNIISSDSYHYKDYVVSRINVYPNYDYYYVNNSVTSVYGCKYGADDSYLGNLTVTNLGNGLYKYNLSDDVSYIKVNASYKDFLYRVPKTKKQEFSFHTNVKKPYLFNGKTATFFGDSITYGSGATDNDHKWVTKFANKVGLIATNYGISGSTLTVGTSEYASINTTIKNTPSANIGDYIFIAGGINDYDIGASIGAFDSSDTETLNGTLNDLFTYIDTYYSDKEVIFILPINSTRNFNNTLPLDLYRETIYNKCIQHGYSVIDSTDFGFPNDSSSNLNTILFNNNDGLHPNNLGHQLYADNVASKLL